MIAFASDKQKVDRLGAVAGLMFTIDHADLLRDFTGSQKCQIAHRVALHFRSIPLDAFAEAEIDEECS